MKCYMCPSRIGHRTKGYMNFDLYRKIINDLYYYKKNNPLRVPSKQAIYLQGQGEPFISKDIFNMIRYAKEKNYKVGLDTTGSLLSEVKVNELIKSNIDVISFSFYGWSKESYNKIHGNHLFETSFINIINCLHLIKGTDITPLWATLISNQTTADYDYSQYILDKLPVTSTPLPIQNFHDIFKEMKLYDEIKYIEKRELEEINKLNIFSRGIENYVRNNSKAKMGACPWQSTLINWNGDVSPCPSDYSSRYVVGNVGDDSISEIWNNKKYRIFRRSIINNNYRNLNNSDYCNQCSYAKEIKNPLFTKSVSSLFKKMDGIKRRDRVRRKTFKKIPSNNEKKYIFLEKYFPIGKEDIWTTNIMRLKKHYDNNVRWKVT